MGQVDVSDDSKHYVGSKAYHVSNKPLTYDSQRDTGFITKTLLMLGQIAKATKTCCWEMAMKPF